MHQNGVSSFVEYYNIKHLWRSVSDGIISEFENLFYTVESPVKNSNDPKLLVIFSSIADPIYAPNLTTRCFTKNFATIAKYIPEDTFILRIADIGGIIAAFYSNTKFLTDNQEKIQRLLSFVRNDLCVPEENVILYGGSKGASAALLHGVSGGYNFVAVDPIVNDEYYIKTYNDSHFTDKIFIESKEKLYEKILNVRLTAKYNCLISSRLSPQYPYIKKIVLKSLAAQDLIFINSENPDITDHPLVAVKTINTVTTLINGIFYKMIKEGPWHKNLI
jgi:hypothetical protein